MHCKYNYKMKNKIGNKNKNNDIKNLILETMNPRLSVMNKKIYKIQH